MRLRRWVVPMALAWIAARPGAAQAPPDIESDGRAVASVEAVNIGAVEARTGALLLSGQAGGDVDGALTWSITGRTVDGRAVVPFIIEVDGDALLRDDKGRHLRIGVYAYVVGDDGRVVDHQAQGLRLARESFASRITRSGVKYVGRFELASGSYALRVLVRNHTTNAYFMSWSPVDVPAADDVSAHLQPPLFPDLEDAWVVARQAGVEAAVNLGSGLAILPAARPTLTENLPAELFVSDRGWTPGSHVGVRIVNDIGRTVAEPVVGSDPAAAGGAEFRRLALSPIDLPPGSYILVLSLDDDAGGDVLRRDVRIAIVGPHEDRSWASDAGATAAADPPADGSKQRRTRRELRNAYVEALSILAGGDADGARRAVARLERQAMVEPSAKALTGLTDLEQGVTKELAAANPASLAPIALLHRRLERSYIARNEGMLATHARTMTVETAAHLGRMLPDDAFPAGLMVNVAVDIAQAEASSAARALLERTLRIAPGSRPAMLSLGFSFERSGEHAEAALAYDKLVSADPGNDEGRLRLAVNLIRIGRERAGEEMLRELLDDGAPRWIEGLAAQELARHLIDDRRPGDAEEEVRIALQRMPDDQRLWILLAAVLEDLGRHDEAVDALRELPAATRGVSPRARYAEWPDLGSEASQQRLTERANLAHRDLAVALVEVRR